MIYTPQTENERKLIAGMVRKTCMYKTFDTTSGSESPAEYEASIVQQENQLVVEEDGSIFAHLDIRPKVKEGELPGDLMDREVIPIRLWIDMDQEEPQHIELWWELPPNPWANPFSKTSNVWPFTPVLCKPKDWNHGREES